MSDKRKEKLTDRQTTKELDIESLMKEFEAQRRERNRRGRNKSKKRGRR